METVSLDGVLHQEQKYVVERARSTDVVRAVRHSIATSTCYEKAEILGWSADRIVKAIYLHSGTSLFGFVFPEYELFLDQKRVLSDLLGISGSAARRFRMDMCPEGMMRGTCTPFVFSRSFSDASSETRLEGIFVQKDEELDEKIVDISIGGIDDDARKISVHLPYAEMYKILHDQFGSRIRQADLFERRCSENDR